MKSPMSRGVSPAFQRMASRTTQLGDGYGGNARSRDRGSRSPGRVRSHGHDRGGRGGARIFS